MDHALVSRMAQVERRLGALEVSLDRAGIARHGVPPAPAPQREPPVLRTPVVKAPVVESPVSGPPVSGPPPLPAVTPPAFADQAQRSTGVASRTTPAAATRPPSAPPPTPAVDWERFFGLAVLGRVGVAAVLLAAGYFAQLAYKGMPEVGKVLSIYGLAAAFFGVGAFVRAKVARRYVALLWGGATAAAYLAATVAHLNYDLVGEPFALVLLVLASAIGQGLARSLRHPTLASMALGGAFAAPLIADASLAHGWFVLVYLLVLHTWSAWVERSWRWSSARAVGIAGTLLVAAVWFTEHGALDVATYVILHLYLLGLMAPELLRVARRERLSFDRQLAIPICLGLAEAFLVGGTWVARVWGQGIPLPATALLAGSAWTGLAVVFAARNGNRGRGGLLIRGLAYVGGLLLAIGVVIATSGLPDSFPFEPETVGVWGTVLVALGALALRKRLGVGELTASVAIALAAVVAVVPRAPGHVFALFPVAGAGAVALVWFARNGAARITGAWAGLLAVGVGMASGVRLAPHDTLWIAVALVGASGWACGLLALGRHKNNTGLEAQGVAQLWLLAVIWAGYAFGDLRAVQLPLLDPMSMAGLVLAAVGGHAAWLHQRRADTQNSFLLSLWLIALALPLLVGHREVLDAVASLERVARAGWHTLYFAAAAVLLGWLGRRNRPMLGIAALVVTAIALLSTVLGVELRGASPWAAAQLAATLVAALSVAWLGARRQPAPTFWALNLYGSAAACWVLYASAGRLPHDPALFNLRFLVGLLALGGALAYPYARLERGLRTAALSAAKFAGITLGFLVGQAEIWALVKPLEGAWPMVLISVYMVLYAAALLTVGFARRDAQLRYPALALFGVVVLKIGLIDLASAETALRIFVTGILGLVLLASAYAYARRTGRPPPPSGDGGPTLKGTES